MPQLPKTIQILKAKKFQWINVTKPGKQEIGYLKKFFNFNDMDLRACLPPLQRPRFTDRPNYLFTILLFPIYCRKTKVVTPVEVDFFIAKNIIITVHNNELLPLNDFFKQCQESKDIWQKYNDGNPGLLLYEILDHLLLYCFPMLNHIGLDIDNIESAIFAGNEKEMVREILGIKRNIVNFRRSMQAHKNVIKKLISRVPHLFAIDKLTIYFDDLLEYTKEIWDLLENYRDTINALHDTNESLISFRLNKIMKTLTIFSVIVFPLTLLSSIFGMNMPGMPFMDDSGFWKVVAIMVVGMAFMLWFFKRKRWL